ncbi:MAG: AAA family ATPase [Patescibacteria group bacterium]
MILTISGASGAGKTTIARALLEHIPNTRFVRSYTTRGPRPSDIPGEFTYLNKMMFDSMRASNDFLWAADIGETSVGTRIEDVEKALKDAQRTWIMVLVPEVIPKLYEHAKHIAKQDAIRSVYILAEADDVLRKRMVQRGDVDSQIEERLKSCHIFQKDAQASGIPYEWIRNDGTIQEAVGKVEGILKKGH